MLQKLQAARGRKGGQGNPRVRPALRQLGRAPKACKAWWWRLLWIHQQGPTISQQQRRLPLLELSADGALCAALRHPTHAHAVALASACESAMPFTARLAASSSQPRVDACEVHRSSHTTQPSLRIIGGDLVFDSLSLHGSWDLLPQIRVRHNLEALGAVKVHVWLKTSYSSARTVTLNCMDDIQAGVGSLRRGTCNSGQQLGDIDVLPMQGWCEWPPTDSVSHAYKPCMCREALVGLSAGPHPTG